MTFDSTPCSRDARNNTVVGSRCYTSAQLETAGRPGHATPQQRSQRGSQRGSRSGRVPSGTRPGSALLLTLICLVMMVLLGTAYVQVARVDRRATRQIAGVDNMSTVRDAVLEYIGEVLRRDVVGPGAIPDDPSDDTLMFNASAADTSHFSYLNGYTPISGNMIEGYDYPFTNRNVTYPVTRADGSALGDSIGGVQDDTWLADNGADESFIPTVAFRHISNLNGVFLRLPKSTSAQKLPYELRTTTSWTTNTAAGDGGSDGLGGFTSTTGLRVGGHNGSSVQNDSSTNSLDNLNGDPNYERAGIDVDKDGITDSRPTWAPEHVRQIGSTAYVVSYRIIDSSALINLNVATGYHESATSPKSTPGDDPGPTYGLYPSDTDFLRLIKHMATYITPAARPANWRTEVNNVHAHRNLNNLPIQPGVMNLKAGADADRADYTFGDQYGAWHGRQGSLTPWGAKYHGYENFKFGIASEVRLRQKGGVVPSSGEVSPLELAMPDVLRTNDAPESYYTDVDGNNFGSGFTAKAGNHMTGGTQTVNSGGLFASVRPMPSLRNMFTVYSGANDYAPRVLHLSTGDPSTYTGDDADDIYKVDLVHRHVTRPSNNPVARLQMIQERLYKVLTVGNKNYLNMSEAECQEFSIQWALNIVDYSDDDGFPSKWENHNGRDYYGTEIMPYLKEFYLQMGYLLEDKMDFTDPCNPIAGTDNMYDTLTQTDDTNAFIVEVGNPFDREVDLSNFRVAIRQGTTRHVTANLIGTLGAFNPSDLPKGKKVFVLDQNTLDAAESGLGDDVKTQLVDAGAQFASTGNDLTTTVTGNLNNLTPDTDIVVELMAKLADNSYVVYDRMVIADFKFPDTHMLATQIAVNGAPEYQFFQFAARRAGEVAGSGDNPPTIGYLSNHGIVSTKRLADDAGGFKQGDPFEKLAVVDKGITPDPKLTAAKLYIRVPNRRILNVAELGYIFSGGGFTLTAGSQTDLYRGLPETLFGEGGNGLDASGGATSIPIPEQHFLSLPSTGNQGLQSAGLDIPTDLKVPHVAYLFDNFTCLSSAWDGLDTSNTIGAKDDNEDVPFAPIENADDQSAFQSEHFIPGRININTAPWFLPAESTPLPESFGLSGTQFYKPNYQYLYQQIALYRDQPYNRHQFAGSFASNTLRGVNNQSTTADFGFVSIGELMLIRLGQSSSAKEANTAERSAYSMLLYAASNEPKLPIDDVRKIYPARYNYDQLTGTPGTSAYISSNAASGFNAGNDGPWPVARDQKYREQDRMVRFHFINPTLSVRSDTFVAYFEIRAYNAADFSIGAQDTKSYVALYDRSNIRTTEDTTKIVTWVEQ